MYCSSIFSFIIYHRNSRTRDVMDDECEGNN